LQLGVAPLLPIGYEGHLASGFTQYSMWLAPPP
jgi:hypothetical protein